MRIAGFLALAAGLSGAILILAHYGLAAVLKTLALLGWAGFLAVVAIHLIVILLDGVAWWGLLPAAGRPRLWTMVWGRLVRDAGSEVLPLSQLGGYALGARAAVLAGVPGRMAVASTIVDITLECLSQLAFAALGLACLLVFRPQVSWARPVAVGLIGGGLLAAAFILAQQRGFGMLERLDFRIARRWAKSLAARAGRAQEAIHAIYRRKGALLAGFLLHWLCWTVSVVEPWLALRLMGSPLSFAEVLAVESLLYAVRSAAFLVPNALGVQEGAYVLLAGLFGVGPGTALALSLLKRARDLVLGVPVLLAWQAIEARRAL